MSARMMLILLTMICLLECCSSGPSVDVNVRLKVYPAGGGDDGYSITVSNDSVFTTKCRIEMTDDVEVFFTETIDSQSLELSTLQLKKLSEDVSQIHPRKLKSKYDEYAEDTWMFVLYVDGNEYCRLNSGSLATESTDPNTERLRNLMNYLIDLSPIELELRGFA